MRSVIFSTYLEAFANHEPLRTRVEHVLNALPAEVQQDFVEDSRFTMLLFDFVPGKGTKVFMAAPGLGANGESVGSRSVVLKARLAECSFEFATYVIAHEFAHAFLRNGPWGEISDIEEAADALAASWGFPRPSEIMGLFRSP